MTLTTVLNVVLSIGVIAMVVAPLVWAILTQQRDHPRPVAAEAPVAHSPDPEATEPTEPSRRGSRSAYKPVVGRA